MYRSDEKIEYPEVVGEYSTGDVFSAAMESSLSLTEAIGHSEKIDRLSKVGVKISAEEAMKRHPHVPFNRDVTESEAEYLAEHHRKLQENQRIINSASDSFLKGTLVPFAAVAIDSITDPAEITLGLATGMGAGALMKGASLAARVSVGAIEAGVSQAITEYPIKQSMEKGFEEYTSEQFTKNVILGSVMQIGITHGGGAALRTTGKALKYAGEKTSENLYRLQKHLEARGINSSLSMNKAIGELVDSFEDVKPLSTAVSKNFEDLDVSGAKTFDEALTPVLEKYKNGEITDEQMLKFTSDAIEEGVNPQMLKHAVDESPHEFSPELVDLVKKQADSDQAQSWFDNSMDDEIDIPDNIEAIDQEIIANSQAKFANLSDELKEVEVEMADGSTIKMGEIQQKINDFTQEVNIKKSFADCLGMGA